MGSLIFKIAFIAPHIVEDKNSRYLENAGHNRAVFVHIPIFPVNSFPLD